MFLSKTNYTDIVILNLYVGVLQDWWFKAPNSRQLVVLSGTIMEEYVNFC
jgi:hypothetical protein